MLGGCRSSAPIPEQGSRLSSLCGRCPRGRAVGFPSQGALVHSWQAASCWPVLGQKALDTQLVGLQHPAFIQELQETDLDRMVRLSLTALSI